VNRAIVLAIAISESGLNYNAIHKYDKQYVGIGGISSRIWLKELKKMNIAINSLQAVEYVYLKIGLKRYKGTKKNMKSYYKTLSIYYKIKKKKI
jgi:hypothetical protein